MNLMQSFLKSGELVMRVLSEIAPISLIVLREQKSAWGPYTFVQREAVSTICVHDLTLMYTNKNDHLFRKKRTTTNHINNLSFIPRTTS